MNLREKNFSIVCFFWLMLIVGRVFRAKNSFYKFCETWNKINYRTLSINDDIMEIHTGRYLRKSLLDMLRHFFEIFPSYNPLSILRKAGSVFI